MGDSRSRVASWLKVRSLSNLSSLSSPPTQSTSSSITSIAAVLHENTPFSHLAILRGIHNTLIEKSYPQQPDVSPSVLGSFGERIVERVQQEVATIVSTEGFDPGIDWNQRVLRPIIATFEIEEDLGMCQGDAEYVFLLVVVLSLAYELLLLADKSKAHKTHAFLGQVFDECFVEPEICRTVGLLLDAERERLARMSAEIKRTKAIQDMRMLLPEINMCITAWDVSMLRNLGTSDIASYVRRHARMYDVPKPEVRISRWSEDAATTFFGEARTFAPVRCAADAAPDVQVKIFLERGCSLPFYFVTSIAFRGDRAMIHTSEGLSLVLEEGCSISSITGVCDRMRLTRWEGSKDGFIGTMSIPPGCLYRAANVTGFAEGISNTLLTIIDTATATFEVDGDNYCIRHVDFGSTIVVEHRCQ
ncbi:uncharacterized protein J4E84_010413 [Alternaria hordeiaustralica]|uniref:uncharacterized protein n=1 Tax=Alternaria hordeiaustralica TaxID=1187925 RepID=UPI0020C5B1D1|nr:uncharacterized protein J4E84_010413 [Alternaria hordeiaustralica]KAI4674807.1 hypothetical protein J4E84_010413 [Alternaria hordeiaustralica]